MPCAPDGEARTSLGSAGGRKMRHPHRLQGVGGEPLDGQSDWQSLSGALFAHVKRCAEANHCLVRKDVKIMGSNRKTANVVLTAIDSHAII